eukprot:Partr_v1_DN26696_c1_g1_i1_m69332 putative Component of the ERMES MDM complex, which serves as a molecular tether to connect the endoplasmic reticulum and mitochondria. Components of this complex are involved in the control of mitochondrial shape and protein biogenesis and may function in phospholipid exchange. mdm10 is involved in the late assembly steps of the general translocase of the mitochondrial outer membrane (TOM complex). Functions in the tom40-specific route of the assembly of outer me
MLDYMESNLLAFFRHSGWNYENSYPSLTAFCKHALDFQPPRLPASLVVCKNISPFLKSSFALNIPNLHHMSFLASSIPVQRLDKTVNRSAYEEFRDSVQVALDSLDLDSATTTPAVNEVDENGLLAGRQYLLFGRLFSDNHLEAIWAHRLSPHVLSYLSASSNPSQASSNSSQIYAKLQHSTAYASSELTYSSVRSMFGLRKLNHFKFPSISPNVLLSLGGEVYMTVLEKSGGLSIGTRIRVRDSTKAGLTDLSIIANPAMGYITAVYGTMTANDLLLSTRYDFNIYSFDSDLSVGLVYFPRNRDQLMKIRLGFQQGLAVAWEASNGPVTVSIGANTNSAIVGSGTLGVEIQYSRD